MYSLIQNYEHRAMTHGSFDVLHLLRVILTTTTMIMIINTVFMYRACGAEFYFLETIQSNQAKHFKVFQGPMITTQKTDIIQVEWNIMFTFSFSLNMTFFTFLSFANGNKQKGSN